MKEHNKAFPASEMSGDGKCEISINERGVFWGDHPKCGRKVTHEIDSGREICSYHAKQKSWKKYNPVPIIPNP